MDKKTVISKECYIRKVGKNKFLVNKSILVKLQENGFYLFRNQRYEPEPLFWVISAYIIGYSQKSLSDLRSYQTKIFIFSFRILIRSEEWEIRMSTISLIWYQTSMYCNETAILSLLMKSNSYQISTLFLISLMSFGFHI